MSSKFEITSKTILDIPDKNKLIIGIDLGTTFSCIGAYRANKIDIVVNDVGKRVTPSLVSFRNGEILVGEAASNIMNQNAENTIKDSKRLIGRRFNEPTVQEDLKKWAFTITENSNGLPQYVINVGDEEKKIFS
jgi:molecular chaperone DnaK (HSP70)